MNLPPGLGLDSPTVEQAKAKNPRRKAKKKKLSRPLSDALPENGVTAAAEQASSSSSRQGDSCCIIRKPFGGSPEPACTCSLAVVFNAGQL